MSRRRRRRQHADPATLPRRGATAERGASEPDRERARAELLRLHESLARTAALMAAASVYFGVWVANTVFGLFPEPERIDLAHPQFLIGVGVLIGAIFAGRRLARTTPTLGLVRYATMAAAALAVVLAGFLGLFLAGPALAADGAWLVIGMTLLSWGLVVGWLVFARRRARTLLERARTT